MRPYILDWMMHFLPMGGIQKKTVKSLHDLTDKVCWNVVEFESSIKLFF